MRRILTICTLLIPAIALGGEVLEFSSEHPEGTAQLSSETSDEQFWESSSTSDSSEQSARVQVAYEVKQDAEGYLVGSEMTRALSLKLEQLHSDNPDLESDELVEHALDEADAVIAEQ